MKNSPSALRALTVLVVVGSLGSLVYNVASPKGILSLTAKYARTALPSALPDPAPAPRESSSTDPAPQAAAPAAATPAPSPEKTEREAAVKEATKPADGAVETATSATHPRKPAKKRAKAGSKAADSTATAHASKAAPAPAKADSSVAAAQAPAEPPSLKMVETAEVVKIFVGKGALFVDARSSDEYALGHIPGAVSLPVDDFEKDFPKAEATLHKAPKIVVYCEGEDCDKASDLGWKLLDKGLRNTVDFKKGWAAWEAAGYPTETGQGAGK